MAEIVVKVQHAPITDAQFRESVQVSEDFNATLFARSPEVNYPVAIAAEPTGAIYVASDEQGSLGTDKDGGKVLALRRSMTAMV